MRHYFPALWAQPGPEVEESRSLGLEARKSVDPFRGNDVLEPPGDRVYPIPLTPFPFDPPPQKHVHFAKSHVPFGPNRHNGRFLGALSVLMFTLGPF